MADRPEAQGYLVCGPAIYEILAVSADGQEYTTKIVGGTDHPGALFKTVRWRKHEIAAAIRFAGMRFLRAKPAGAQSETFGLATGARARKGRR